MSSAWRKVEFPDTQWELTCQAALLPPHCVEEAESIQSDLTSERRKVVK